MNFQLKSGERRKIFISFLSNSRLKYSPNSSGLVDITKPSRSFGGLFLFDYTLNFLLYFCQRQGTIYNYINHLLQTQ